MGAQIGVAVWGAEGWGGMREQAHAPEPSSQTWPLASGSAQCLGRARHTALRAAAPAWMPARLPCHRRCRQSQVLAASRRGVSASPRAHPSTGARGSVTPQTVARRRGRQIAARRSSPAPSAKQIQHQPSSQPVSQSANQSTAEGLIPPIPLACPSPTQWRSYVRSRAADGIGRLHSLITFADYIRGFYEKA